VFIKLGYFLLLVFHDYLLWFGLIWPSKLNYIDRLVHLRLGIAVHYAMQWTSHTVAWCQATVCLVQQ